MGSSQGLDLAPFFGDLSQSEELSEIKPPLKDILKPMSSKGKISLDTLKKMNRERKSRQQKSKVSKRSLVNNAAKNFMEITTNYFKNPLECMQKLECMNMTVNSNYDICQKIKC